MSWILNNMIIPSQGAALSKRPTKIILVHGTWPDGHLLSRTRNFIRRSVRYLTLGRFYQDFEYGVRWDREGSQFCKTLLDLAQKEVIEVNISNFQWNGKNSISIRQQESERLAQLLNNISSENDSENIFVIGHSHGGTIACKAIELINDTKNIFVITLGTPFLELKQAGRTHYTSDRIMAALSAYGVIMALAPFLPKNILYDVLIALLALSLLTYTYKQINIMRNQEQTIELSSKIISLCASSSLEHLIVKGGPSLIIRTPYDNAGMSLSVILFIEAQLREFMNNIEEIVSWFTISSALVSVLFTAYQLVIYRELHRSASAFLTTIIWATAGALIPLSFALISFIFRKILLKSYGAKFSDNTFDVEICLNTTPDTNSGYEVKTVLPELNRRLNRHSIYENVKAIDLIFNYIVGKTKV